MVKWALLLGTAMVGGWFYGVDGRKLDEQLVRDFYQQQWHATYSRDPEALCDQYARQASVTQETRLSGRTTTDTMNRTQACERLREMFKFFEMAGEKAGGMLTIEYAHKLHEIEIAPDRKSARVVFSSTLKMGETFFQVSTTAHERLERSLRRVQLAQADAKVRVSWKPGALINPEQYFRAQ